jgi:hypothetical protein
MHAIKTCKYVWLSHGHPDHISGESLNLLKTKKILLPDHAGNRIASGLRNEGFDVVILKDRLWITLTPRLRVLSIADYNQDAILLVDIHGTLLVNLNDASDRGWRHFVKREISRYKESFLLQLSGYGDAEMINFFDENGARIEPQAAMKSPVGKGIANTAETFGVSHFIPFSSMHRYQRADSVWVNQYTTPLNAYQEGFTSKRCDLLPAFVRYDCSKKEFIEINPKPNPDIIIDPKNFGDDWSECLDKDDVRKIDAYFRAITHIQKHVDFLNFRVGGVDNRIEFKRHGLKKGVKFEVPRHSLMQAIEYEIFDDLLIGNFMKTTLEGHWPQTGLYPDFTPYVAKYSDNGRAKTREELRQYFHEYRKRASLDYLRHRIQNCLFVGLRARVKSDTKLYQFARNTWWLAQRWI